MKLSPLNLSAICICIGLGGFVLGKLTSGNAEVSEHDRILAESERLIQRHSIDAGSDSRTRQRSNRPNRPTQQSGSTSLDQKLVSLKEISRDTNPFTRGRAMLDWIDSLAPEEFEPAVEQLRSLKLKNEYGDYLMLMAAWGEVDPISALAYTDKTSKAYGSGTGHAAVLTAWAPRDTDAAIAWARSKYPGAQANPFITTIISAIVATDPVRAAALLQELPPGKARDNALGAMTPHLVRIGEEAAKNWISELSDQSLRSRAIARLAVALAEKDPAGSATWLLENINESTIESVGVVFTQWTKVDPKAAIAHFENIQDREARSRALYAIVAADTKNPQATVDLMDRFANDLTENAVEDFIWANIDRTPNLAIDQIRKIQDQSTRNNLYKGALNSWLEDDEVAAKKWISSANLPASVIDSLNETTDDY